MQNISLSTIKTIAIAIVVALTAYLVFATLSEPTYEVKKPAGATECPQGTTLVDYEGDGFDKPFCRGEVR